MSEFTSDPQSRRRFLKQAATLAAAAPFGHISPLLAGWSGSPFTRRSTPLLT